MKRNFVSFGLFVTSIFVAPMYGLATTGECVRSIIAQINASKEQSRLCFNQLEADIQAAIDAGTPLPPLVIDVRTSECESFDVTPELRKALLGQCRE